MSFATIRSLVLAACEHTRSVEPEDRQDRSDLVALLGTVGTRTQQRVGHVVDARLYAATTLFVGLHILIN